MINLGNYLKYLPYLNMFERHKNSLIQCFELLQKIKANPSEKRESVLELQQLILKRIIGCENRIKKFKEEHNNLKRQLAKKDIQFSKANSLIIKSRIKRISIEIATNHKLIWIYREVGDGIAFIYIDGFDLKPLAFKQSPGFISGKKGTRLERKVLRNTKVKSEYVLLMNDLTNCLRYGDFTLATNQTIVKILELKSGKKRKIISEHDHRQLLNANKMLAFLHSNEIDELYGKKGKVIRGDAHKEIVRNTGIINSLIDDSKNKGCAFIVPESGLLYIVAKDLNFENAFKSVNRNDEWMFDFINEYKFKNTGHYPFTLLIENPENLFDFYNGNFHIIVGMNFSFLKTELAKKGQIYSDVTETDLATVDGIEHYIFFVTDSSGICTGFSDFFVRRVFVEFVGFDWFKNEVINGTSLILEEAKKQNFIS